MGGRLPKRTVVWKWFLALAIVLGLGAGLGASASAQTQGQSLPQTRTPASARFDIKGSVASGGETVTMNGTGSYSSSGFQMDMTMQAPAGTTSGPQQIGLNMILLEGKVYFKMSGLTPGGQGEDQWYVTDVNSLLGNLGAQGGMMGMPGSITGIDQSMLQAITVTNEGKETILGVSTTRYRLDVDMAKASASMGTTDPQTEAILKGSTMVLTVWIGDKDQYAYRYSMSMQIAGGTSGDTTIPPIAMDFTLNFSDFDVPVTITAPANAQPLDLTTSGVNLPIGGVLTGMPGMTTGMGTTSGMPKTGGGQGQLPLWLLGLGVLSLGSGLAVRRVALRKAEARAR